MLGAQKQRSVQRLAGHGGAVESFTGGDDGEIELFEEFLGIVALDGVFRRPVDGGDVFQGLAHDLHRSRIHKCLSLREWIVRRRKRGCKGFSQIHVVRREVWEGDFKFNSGCSCTQDGMSSLKAPES